MRSMGPETLNCTSMPFALVTRSMFITGLMRCGSVNVMVPLSIVYLLPKNTSSPCEITTRPNMPGRDAVPRTRRCASAWIFCASVVRN